MCALSSAKHAGQTAHSGQLLMLVGPLQLCLLSRRPLLLVILLCVHKAAAEFAWSSQSLQGYQVCQRSSCNMKAVSRMQVLKQEWPHAWPSFVPDLVGASKTSETLCENSMIILKLLSEEVFDFSRGHLTQVSQRSAF